MHNADIQRLLQRLEELESRQAFQELTVSAPPSTGPIALSEACTIKRSPVWTPSF